MVVYIEDAVLDTTAINFTILFLTQFSLRQKFCFLKNIFVAVLGCAFSIALTFLNIQSAALIIALKILCGLIMCAIAVNKFSFKFFSLFFLVFLSFTFLVGGFCFFVIYLLGGQVYSVVNMKYNLPISLGLLTLLIGIYVYFLVNVIKIFYKKQKLSQFYYTVVVKCNNKKLQLNAYLDSGNLLQDSSGLPILIINYSNFIKLFDKEVTVVDYLNLKLDTKIKGKYILTKTVNGNSKIFTFSPQNVYIKQNKSLKPINVLLAVSQCSFANKDFDALLSPLAI